jgi:hypothetical protein
MILIRGETGVGKSAALRALESDPPLGWRGAYVPVPTLDFPGLAGWCIERLGEPAEGNPVAALRAAHGRTRLLLLIDDADRLPLDTARDLAAFERTGTGTVAIIAACVSGTESRAALSALGPAAETIEVVRGSGKQVAAELRDRFESARVRRVARPIPPPRTAQSASDELPPSGDASPIAQEALATPRAPGPAEPAPAQTAASVRKEVRSGAAEIPPREARSVPLWLAVAAAVTAFLLPVAFFSGYWLGRSGAVAQLSRLGEGEDVSSLPAVAAAPPEEPARSPVKAPERGKPARNAQRDVREPAPAERDDIATDDAASDDIASNAAPAPTLAEPQPSAREADAKPADEAQRDLLAPLAEEGEGDPPVLISVAPPASGP